MIKRAFFALAVFGGVKFSHSDVVFRIDTLVCKDDSMHFEFRVLNLTDSIVRLKFPQEFQSLISVSLIESKEDKKWRASFFRIQSPLVAVGDPFISREFEIYPGEFVGKKLVKTKIQKEYRKIPIEAKLIIDYEIYPVAGAEAEERSITVPFQKFECIAAFMDPGD